MFVRIGGVGATGVIHDTVGEALSSGTWTDALNMRFTGVEMQKMLEPEILSSFPLEVTTAVWMQFWADGLTTFLAVATGSNIWLYRNNGVEDRSWVKASRPEEYNTDGYWDSFAWGDTCIFNNGIDPPQIYNGDTGKFEDLPRWGLISTADDIFNNDPPSRKVAASCVKLVPFKGFLVAIGITESGLYQPNKVWWSDITNDAGYAGCPNWDYETPASLSGQIVVDPEGGAIRTGVQLNEQLIIYNDASSTAMSFVGGTYVMQFRRLFNKGAAGLHAVAEFNNQHFCVSQDQIYLHDGNQVNLIAKDRVEEEFFKRIGKGGRFGDGAVLWDSLQVVKNPDRKEIIISYTDPVTGGSTQAPSTCVPVTIDQQPVNGNSGSGTVTFTVSASGTEPITYQWFENGQPIDGETGESLTVPDTSTSIYYAVVDNPCGSAQSDVVTIVEECVPAVITQQPVDYPIGLPPEVVTIASGGISFNGFGFECLVITDPDNGDILFNQRGYGPILQSRDIGGTFTTLNLRQQNSGEILVSMRYDETTGRLWHFPNYDQQRLIRSEYSDDFSTTANIVWNTTNTPFGNGLFAAYTHGILVDDGKFWHLNAESLQSGSIIRHEDPGNLGNAIEDSAGYTFSYGSGNAIPISSGDLSSWGTVSINNDKMFITYSGQGQSVKYGMIVDKTTLVQDVDLGIISEDPNDPDSPCHQVKSDGSTARVIVEQGATTGIVKLGLVTATTTATPLPTVNYDFGEPVFRPVLGYGGGRWLVVAHSDANREKLLVMGDGITGVVELTMPLSSPAVDVYRELYWDSFSNRWLYAGSWNDVVAREMYLFGLEGIY